MAVPIQAEEARAPLASSPARSQTRLREEMFSAHEGGTRRAAIDGLQGSGDLGALLQSVTSDRDPLVRRWAALALERRARGEHLSALQQAVAGEPDRVVRHVLERAVDRARHLLPAER